MSVIAGELVESIEKVIADHDRAKAVVRQVLVDFGGMRLYLPATQYAFCADETRSETVEELIESVSKIIVDRDQAKAIVRKILDDFGGMQVYLPISMSAFRSETDAQIYEEFTGSNSRELVRKFGVSFATLYNIVRREKNRRGGNGVDSAQQGLDFGEEG